jgi:ribosomal protein S15P/S13E
MTVPELRQILKESSHKERGLLSRLKRKQDLIEYLKKNDPTVQDMKVNDDNIIELIIRRHPWEA